MEAETYHAVLSENSRRVLESRCLRKDAGGSVTETPDQMFQRVATAISSAELGWGTKQESDKWQYLFFNAMRELRFLPNSPVLMNAGTPSNQLSACFVLPVEDHLEQIFSTLKLSALIQQSGGGTGFNFSHLRPKHDLLVSSQGTSSGPVSFMKVFDAATEHVKQGGKRRGANMGILNIDHPDIEEFIACKRVEGDVRNFNISIGITDAFMKALHRNDVWHFINPNSKKIAGSVSAKSLWDSIVHHAWLTGDPGLIFLDTINASNPTPSLGKIEATNPCGEVPLLAYESCNLASINLNKFINGAGRQASINWEYFGETISLVIRFLDDVIEINKYLVPEIMEMANGNRKVGLGVMGWADILATLEIPYDSDRAIKLGGDIMHFIATRSSDASRALAKERGVFKNWEKSVFSPHTPIRNATRTSIAPTGTISIIADASSSIEPFFALAYQRMHVLENEVLEETNKVLLQHLELNGMNNSDVIAEIREKGSVQNVRGLTPHLKSIFKTALEIPPGWHLKHQAAFQRYTDNAVSKTINLRHTATPSDISRIYECAWRKKLKGITVFRCSSRKNQVLNQGIAGGIRGCRVCIE